MKTGIIIVIILGLAVIGYGLSRPNEELAETPTPSSTPKTSSIPTKTPGQTITPTPSISLSPTVTPSEIPTQTPTQTPTPTPAPTAQTHVILMQNRTYNPSTLTVAKGDAVIFRAVDTFYSVVVTGRSSGRLQPGQEWTLNSGEYLPGTYSISDVTYTTMRGTLVIQ